MNARAAPRAATLLRTVAESTNGIDDARDRLANQVGQLQAIVRNLYAQYTGDGAVPPTGSKFATVIAGAADVLVEYEYQPAEDANHNVESSTVGPGCAASVAIIQALVNGRWCDPQDVFSDTLIERWREGIAESEDEQAREASEPPERNAYDDKIDFAEAQL